MISLDQLREEHFKKTCCLTSSTALLAEPLQAPSVCAHFLDFPERRKGY
jgi:hypothetical protein